MVLKMSLLVRSFPAVKGSTGVEACAQNFQGPGFDSHVLSWRCVLWQQ